MIRQCLHVQVLSDVWEQEAKFAAAKYAALAAYYEAYQHATDLGLEDVLGNLASQPPSSASSSNQPQVLAARRTLRRCAICPLACLPARRRQTAVLLARMLYT